MQSIVVLMDYHHDRNKDDVERVVMYSRVSLNSYNVNAQVNCKVMIVIKENPTGAVCTGACLCLERKLDSSLHHERRPPKLLARLFLLEVVDRS
jgi:hypothetical protein